MNNSILRYFLLAAMLFFIINIEAQSTEWCGTSIKDQQKMDQIFENEHSQVKWSIRDEKIYVPIKFHLLANNDGSSRLPYVDVLKQLARLNRDYAEWDMVFYLKDSFDFDLLNKSNAFLDPRTNEDYLKSQKDPSALNVFVVSNIGDSGTGVGIVLGYYSPTNDFVVARQKELTDSTNTLSHEIGHFFSLKHTFYGWEEFPYDEATHGNPYTKPFVPGSTTIQTEWVDRSNCNVAGDQLCDTPPDFNFGISQNGCSFGKIIKDKNLDTIVPMKNNQMSYFSNCARFQFTPDQISKVKENYGTSKRNYIRLNYLPIRDTLPAMSVPITPENGVKIETYNSVYFSWEDQGAQYYLINIYNGQENYSYFTSNTELLVQDLKANKLYFYIVRPFNEGYTDNDSPVVIFRTGSSTTATENTEIFKQLTIFPIPSNIGDDIKINLNSEEKSSISVSLLDNLGRNLFTKQTEILQGENFISIPTERAAAGIYFVSIQSPKGTYTKKIILQ